MVAADGGAAAGEVCGVGGCGLSRIGGLCCAFL